MFGMIAGRLFHKNRAKAMTKKVCFVVIIWSVICSGCAITESLMHQSEFNEKLAIIGMRSIFFSQTFYRQDNGQYTDDLRKLVAKEFIEIEKNGYTSDGYRFEMTSDGNSFQIWATPDKYGVTGNMSFYADDKSAKIFGANHQGAKANVEDSLIEQLSN
jgi:hypothetical protein